MPFQKEPMDLRFSVLNEVEAYWEGLRNGRPMPERTDVDPRGIERALEFSFIIERISPAIARFRVAGRHLNELMGMDVRGMPLTAFFHADARDTVTQTTSALFEKPQISRLSLLSTREPHKSALDGALLLLPLLNEFGEVNRALGCLATEGSIGRVPRRFRVSEMRVRELNSDWQRTTFPTRMRPLGFAEGQADYALGRPKTKPDETGRPALPFDKKRRLIRQRRAVPLGAGLTALRPQGTPIPKIG